MSIKDARPTLAAGCIQPIVLYKCPWIADPRQEDRRTSQKKTIEETAPSRRRRSMAEQFVGKIAEFKDGDRRIIFAGDNEIGIFRHEGQFYAYSNFCLHQGGPACEGLTIAKVRNGCCPTRPRKDSTFPRPKCISC